MPNRHILHRILPPIYVQVRQGKILVAWRALLWSSLLHVELVFLERDEASIMEKTKKKPAKGKGSKKKAAAQVAVGEEPAGKSQCASNHHDASKTLADPWIQLRCKQCDVWLRRNRPCIPRGRELATSACVVFAEKRCVEGAKSGMRQYCVCMYLKHRRLSRHFLQSRRRSRFLIRLL